MNTFLVFDNVALKLKNTTCTMCVHVYIYIFNITYYFNSTPRIIQNIKTCTRRGKFIAAFTVKGR